MSNVIEFLERMGQDASLRYGDNRTIETALVKMNVASDHQATVLRRDQASLEILLGAQTNVCCTIEPFHEHDGATNDFNRAFSASHRAPAAA